MSILIKALKQAERDHLARAAAATPAYTPSAPPEPEPAPVMTAVAAPTPVARGGEALSLEPVEPQQRSHREPAHADVALEEPLSTAPALHEAVAQPSSTHSTYAPPSVDVTARAQAADAAADASRHPAAAVVPAVLPTNEPAGASRAAAAPPIPPLGDASPTASAAATTPAPATARARPAAAAPAAISAAASAATSAAERPATAEDPQAEQRKAARQLMAAAPARLRYRRLALALAIAVLVAGAAALAYWQGLFTGIDGLLQSAPPAPPAATRTLAERMQQSTTVHADKADKSGHAHATTGTATSATAAGPAEGNSARAFGLAGPTAANRGAIAAGAAAGSAMSAESNRAADAIHLRPPEASPERIRALLQDAYTAAGRGDTAGASRIYQQVIDLDHNNGDAWIGMAAIAANGGDAAAANRDYRRALEIDPGDSVALGGLLGVQSGVDPQEAESRLRLLIVRDGAQPALQAALGKMLARQGRWLEAQETFYQAWVADPSQPDVAFNMAVSLERIRQPAAALSFYRRALELSQNHSARFNPAVAQERVAALVPKQQ